MTDLVEKLANSERGYLIAAAGCGKTHIIAEAIAKHATTRQLVLTHTHAGVNSLQKRLKKLGAKSNQHTVDTIASFALRYALAYPVTSGWTSPLPESKEYSELYQATQQLITNNPCIQAVIRATYGGLYVDEYQDCTTQQHQLVLALAEIIPCRILGDPLQGIFGFAGQTPVNWDSDVKEHFNALPELTTPYRWRGKNEQLGDWLLEIRELLETNNPISFSGSEPISVLNSSSDNSNERKICFEKANQPGSVVVIHPENSTSAPCRRLASQLKGTYQSIETMEASDLLDWADKIGDATGCQRVVHIIDFASKCMTRVSTRLRTIRGKFENENLDFRRIKNHRDIAELLVQVADDLTLQPILPALNLIKEIDGAYLYRGELWCEMHRAIKAKFAEKYDTLYEAAYAIRQKTRITGRTEYPRIVSRTLLIKGLEYDHAIILDADKMDKRNLYVAMTRGSRSLTIFSENNILQPR